MQAENASPGLANFDPLEPYHNPNYAGQPRTLPAAQIHAIKDICYGITFF